MKVFGIICAVIVGLIILQYIIVGINWIITKLKERNEPAKKRERSIIKKERKEALNRALNRQKPITKGKKYHRNDPCSCGSGKKNKKCCNKTHLN